MADRRYTQEAAREQILQAGLDLVVEHGPSLGLENVSFAEAIERADVPRPTAYRAFAAIRWGRKMIGIGAGSITHHLGQNGCAARLGML